MKTERVGRRRYRGFLTALCAALVTGGAIAACSTGGLPQSIGQGISQVQVPVGVLHQAPQAPAELQLQTASGQALAPNSWTNQPDLQLAATLASPEQGVVLYPEAEFVPVEQSFSGTPNLTGRPAMTTLPVPPMQDGQRYHWQIRAHEVGGKPGPWAAFSGAIGYAATGPKAPAVAPLPNDGFTSEKQASVTWSAEPGAAGIAGYAYALGRQPAADPPAQPATQDAAARVSFPEDGDWTLTVWAQDIAGNWSAPATATFHVDTVPVGVKDVTYRTFAFNPSYSSDPLPISLTLTKPADVTVTIVTADATDALRTLALGEQPAGVVRLAWDGKDEGGAVVPPGQYRFRLQVSDKAGHQVDLFYDKLLITQKRIVVSLGRESLTAYDGDSVAISTLVTTGGPELPTPTGTFQILAKYTPFTFKSPFPKGSPYWYPDSPTSYAMLFDEGGYFIHDAPWRGYFGPGSNAQYGTPGGNTTGTHGCVNVPLGIQARLFGWSDVGTPVIVQW